MDDVPRPEPPDPEPRTTSPIRQVALGVVVFVASFAVLLGLTAVIVPAPGPSGPTPSGTVVAGSPSASPSPTRSPVPKPSAPASATATPPSTVPIADPVLVGAGDIGDCDSTGDEATAKLLDRIAGTVFTAGDNVYPAASGKAFRDCYQPTWGRHLDRTRAAAGNHDWLNGGIRAYRDYFGSAGTGPDGTTWYAYDLGAWRVIVLDSDCQAVGGCGTGSPQGRWLADELATRPDGPGTQCTLAIWHHPRFSSGFHGDDKAVAPFWKALYAAGADVVINGHEHDYERFAPQDPAGREDRVGGIREFVVGTGGTPLRPFERTAPNSELRASVTHGVLALTLHDGSYDWQFHPTSTDFSDRGTAFCH